MRSRLLFQIILSVNIFYQWFLVYHYSDLVYMVSLWSRIKNLLGISKTEKNVNSVEVYLSSIVAEDVMREMGDIYPVDINYTLGDIASIFGRVNTYIILVYKDDMDNIIGSIDVRRIVNFISNKQIDKNILLSSLSESHRDYLIKKPLVVSQYMDILSIMTDLKKTGREVAVIVDERGSMDGYITMNDIMKYITEDAVKFEKIPLADKYGYYIVSGSMKLDDFVYILEIIMKENKNKYHTFEILKEQEQENDTINGMICSMLGKVPEAGEKIKVGELSMIIEDASLRKIKRIKFKTENSSTSLMKNL